MTRFLGHYRILRSLGRGGMGEVHLAEDETLGRRVALKTLPPEVGVNEGWLQRFRNEARLAAALSHPGIVTLHSFEEHGGTAFLTMEYVEGQTFDELFQKGPLNAEHLGSIAVDLAEALGHAHARGITHRDLKPANLMLSRSQQIKILDFGLAKIEEAGDLQIHATAVDTDELTRTSIRVEGITQDLTAPGKVAGTPAYMSPEQALARPADPRSDVFSLGVILYQAAAGVSPYPERTAAKRLAAILREAAQPLAKQRPDLPVGLSRAIDRCLRSKPEQRFQTACELETALRGERVVIDADASSRVQSIAVLPFNDLSANRDQEHLCDGMAEELLDALTGLRGVRVASRTSTLQFKGAAEDVRRIGEQLSVESVVEGSVRTAGERMRVSVQFTSAADGYLLWSGKYDRSLEDLFDAQGEIAVRVADALRTEIVGGPHELGRTAAH